MKTTTELLENWENVKDRLQRQFTQLTDDDVRLENGKEDQMLDRIQNKLGKSEAELHKLISDL